MTVNWAAWWGFIIVAIIAAVLTMTQPEGSATRRVSHPIAWAALICAILLPMITILRS